jgi:PKD repeat protein
MNYRAVAYLLFLVPMLAMLAAVGCDKASPVAPSGTILAISANPTRIALNGTSTITIIGRKPDGNPLNPGTEIQLNATLGSITSIVTTNGSGTATAIFQSNGRLGTARISAAVGTAPAGGGGGTTTSDTPPPPSTPTSASVDVQVGSVTTTIVLQPTPTTLPATGGTVSLLAVLRDDSGQPIANQGVNFTTDLGTLNSRGNTVTTNSSGVARDTLKLTEQDLANNASTVTVSVHATGAAGAAVTQMATIHIQGDRPVASFTYDKGNTELEVQFIDTSVAPGELTYSWNFGDGASSTESSPSHTYAAAGSYNVVLTVTANGLSDTATARITVPVTAQGNST